MDKGMEKGRKEGKEEGRKEGILLTGKNMKQAGIPIQTIGDVTGLSIEQIENL
ncbi:MAG: hypothetical protein GY862_24985 [Gammaproteobacteria bacterium]|nr:hypothetical protein [Gammaproteobacteria bacterium]